MYNDIFQVDFVNHEIVILSYGTIYIIHFKALYTKGIKIKKLYLGVLFQCIVNYNYDYDTIMF